MKQIKHNSRSFRFYCLSLLLLVVVAHLGYRYGNYAAEEQHQQITGMSESIADLNQENHSLTRQLNILGVELEVARLANQRSQHVIEDEEDTSARLRKELSMYQKVMAPELNEDGFSVNSVKIAKTGATNTYRLSLILVQQNKNKGYMKGSVELALKGSVNGKMEYVDLVPMLRPEEKTLAFSFRYFELVDGEFSIPEGFQPEQLIVNSHIRTSKKRRADLERTFSWAEMTGNS